MSVAGAVRILDEVLERNSMVPRDFSKMCGESHARYVLSFYVASTHPGSECLDVMITVLKDLGKPMTQKEKKRLIEELKPSGKNTKDDTGLDW